MHLGLHAFVSMYGHEATRGCRFEACCNPSECNKLLTPHESAKQGIAIRPPPKQVLAGFHNSGAEEVKWGSRFKSPQVVKNCTSHHGRLLSACGV